MNTVAAVHVHLRSLACRVAAGSVLALAAACSPAPEPPEGAAEAPAEPASAPTPSTPPTPQERQAREFLDANGKRPGVVTTESGLQYEVLASGDGAGAKPGATDRVTTHYHGTLVDGSVFDSSVERGEPMEFRVDGVIPGWTEALQMMRPGDKWKLYVPPQLAYGARGNIGIPANAVLIFEVELIGMRAS